MLNPTERNYALEEFDRREMATFEKMVKAGVMVGVPAALHYCDGHKVAVPEWLVRAALDLLCDLLKREKSTKRGRATGTVARYRQDMIDMLRWDEVCVLRERQPIFHESISYYSKTSMASSPRFAEELERAEWIGHSLARVFECVSEGLERTEAFGSPESIKRSYREVKRNHRSPTKAFRYCVLHPLFLQMLGINPDLNYGRGAKFAPWRKQASKQKNPPKARAGTRARAHANVPRET
jgi:hypothetical protein